jgi:hypothetical protein
MSSPEEQSTAVIKAFFSILAFAIILPPAISVSESMDESRRKFRKEVSEDITPRHPEIQHILNITRNYPVDQFESMPIKRFGILEFVNVLGQTCSANLIQVTHTAQALPSHWEMGDPDCTTK